MSLFERIREKRINLTEQSFTDRQKSDMKKLLNKNFGTKEISKKTATTQKQLSKANREVYNVTGKSAVRDAKKYASGQYPKIGGGTRIGSKSKGPGAETGAKVNLNPTSGSKSKGNKPVTVSTTKTVKQSDISKQAKKFTKKINKRNINRPEGVIGDTYVSTDKKGKIRSAKRVNPTLKKSVSQVKADIEFKKGLQKLGASGDVSDTAPKSVRDYVTKKRETRASKLGLKDPFKIDTSGAAKEVAKDFGTKPVKGGLKFGKPGTGVKDTIKKFQPRDISAKKYEKKVETGLKKAKKSFKQLSRDIQDYRDRDVPGGPRKTRVTRTRVSYRTTPGGRESVGMASKFINKYKKGHPMNPEISGIDFDTPKTTNLKTVSGVTGGGGGKKPPVKRKTGGTGGNKPRKPRKITKKLVSPGVAKVSAAPKATRKITKILGGSSNVDFYKSGSKLARGISKVSPGAGKLALGATKTLAKLGTPGRIAATVGTVAALSPAARKGISGLAKQALAGAGLGGVIGGAAASQKMSDKERIKKNLPAKLEKDKSGKDIKTVTRMNLNLSDVNKKKKDKGRTPQSIATEVEYLKKRQKVAPYGAKYTG